MNKQTGRRSGDPLDPIRPIYLIHGDDDLAAQQFIDELRGRTADESFVEFDWQEVDASVLSVSALLAGIGQLPFGSPYRTTVVRGAEVFKSKGRADDADAFVSGLTKLGAAACVALVVGPSDERGRGKASVAGPRLDAYAEERGIILRFAAPSAADLAERAVALARADGYQLSADAAERLVQAAHGDPRALRNELAKVLAYAGEAKRLNLAHVEAVCSVDPEDVMFRLVDAIGHRLAHRALTLLREACRYETKPHAVAGKLLALVNRQLKLLWQCRSLIDQGVRSRDLQTLPPHIASELPAEASVLSMAFKIRDLYTMAQKWDANALAAGYDALAACDVANKGGDEGSQDVLVNLEVLIVRLCTAG
ncbi:MAG: DNA polymerase III subunit delta [Armatimonadetes bacterium]|nr:DNA polymerase III subunit delta [Armatimonadota bacterium]